MADVVGLVLVSHSRALAQAVRDIARQMAAPSVNIAIAAGVGDERAEFGTDAVEICEAIQSVDSPAGVLVLMDLGSAVLSAEMALDLLPDAMRPRVRLCPAPLVEGAITAAIQAGLGNSLDQVYVEASAALLPKSSHLETTITSGAGSAGNLVVSHPPDAVKPISISVTLSNPHGLHARPAARFVQTASPFDANITVRKGAGAAVSAKSMNKLVMLGVSQGDNITITAQGAQAQQALDALRKLVEDGFVDTSPNTAPPATPISSAAASVTQPDIRAVPVSPGICIGTLRHYTPQQVVQTSHAKPVQDSGNEWARLLAAIEVTALRINAQQARVLATAGPDQAAIFAAHQLILRDEELSNRAHELIASTPPLDAGTAWQLAINEVAYQYRSLADIYMQQRATDVLDVGAQVLVALHGEQSPEYAQAAPVILLADDVTPAQVAQFSSEQMLGIITNAGSTTSHAAILLRALGIPAIAGAGKALAGISEGTLVAVDGSSGLAWINPSNETITALTQQREAWSAQQQALRAASHTLTHTRDGQRVEVAVNLSGLADARLALDNGAEAVGVLRTEFLYLNRTEPPAEAEQTATLQEIAACLQGRPVIVRTLDVGGDKPIPYLPLPHENNPYLGVRAIRLSLLRPDIFVTQVRAILSVGATYPLRILLPMVTLAEELTQARQLIEQAHDSLLRQSAPQGWPMQVGIMIETPAAALLANHLAPLVDFFSIGTNDLTQYTFAAERGNPQVAHLNDALHPSMLMLIQQVVSAAHAHHKWAGVCGEVASDPLAVPLLVGLGVDELSVNVAAVPQVKAIVRAMDMPIARLLAQSALGQSNATQVRELAQAYLDSRQTSF